MSSEKPRVLILGGTGFIGRHLVQHLCENELVSSIRVADKQMPEVRFMEEATLAWFQREELVEFKQCDLTREDHVQERAFAEAGGRFDVVFNLAGETKFGLPEAQYRQSCVDMLQLCTTAARARGVGRWIEVSTASVYKSQTKRAAKEDAALQPWTKQAEAKLTAEEVLRATGLEFVIVRPAIVYGPGDVNGIMPRVVCAAVYKRLGETMKFLWSGSTKLNTVHVVDVARALWHLSREGAPGAVYNLADKGDTDQGKVNAVLSEVFGIKTGFHGTIISNLARVNMSAVAEEANEKHLAPWTELSKVHGIEYTPLTPYIDVELLKQNHLFVDGSAIEGTGFSYSVPALTSEEVSRMIQSYVDLKCFPPVDAIEKA